MPRTLIPALIALAGQGYCMFSRWNTTTIKPDVDINNDLEFYIKLLLNTRHFEECYFVIDCHHN